MGSHAGVITRKDSTCTKIEFRVRGVAPKWAKRVAQHLVDCWNQVTGNSIKKTCDRCGQKITQTIIAKCHNCLYGSGKIVPGSVVEDDDGVKWEVGGRINCTTCRGEGFVLPDVLEVVTGDLHSISARVPCPDCSKDK